jgi:Family of unknown function (DUF5939)
LRRSRARRRSPKLATKHELHPTQIAAWKREAVEKLAKVFDEKGSAMLERMVRDAPDHALNKMNALDLAVKEGIGEERVIAALLNAVGLGIFEMSWSVVCPSCAGVLSANKTLKTVDRAQYNCAFCAAGYETTLDSLVEVTFTVSPRVRKIAAHDPDGLPAANITARFSGVRQLIFQKI